MSKKLVDRVFAIDLTPEELVAEIEKCQTQCSDILMAETKTGVRYCTDNSGRKLCKYQGDIIDISMGDGYTGYLTPCQLERYCLVNFKEGLCGK